MRPEGGDAYVDPEADLTEYIVGKIQDGDRGAFDQLFNRYRERILRVVVRDAVRQWQNGRIPKRILPFPLRRQSTTPRSSTESDRS